MTLDELAKSISNQGLLPIPVEGEVDNEETSLPLFSGTLEEYLKILKVLDTKGIPIYSRRLAESDFIYDADADELYDGEEEFSEEEQDSDDEAPIESTEVDLTIALPELLQYKNSIDSYCAFLLSAVGGYTDLGFYLAEKWWQEFSEERERAIEKVEGDREAYFQKMEQKRDEREKELRKLLRQFIHDDEFVVIPTQRGMKHYAIEKQPELEHLSDSTLTEEVQKLWDKIRTKDLYKKRR